jgi:hypothetical protein
MTSGLTMGGRMKLLWIVCGLISIASPSAQARAPDPRAADAIQFFTTFCFATDVTPTRALAVLGDGNALATRLPADVVRQAQGNREGGIGWAVRSPHDAEFMLDYDARGICGLRLKEADELSVRDAFEAFVKGIKRAVSGAGAELTSEPALEKQVNGTRTTYKGYSFPVGGRTAYLALTTAERPIGAQQHFMTFGFVK